MTVTELVFSDASAKKHEQRIKNVQLAVDSGMSFDDIRKHARECAERARGHGEAARAEEFEASLAAVDMVEERIRDNQELLAMYAPGDYPLAATVGQGRNFLHRVKVMDGDQYRGSVTVITHKPPSGDDGWLYRYEVRNDRDKVLEAAEGPGAPRGEDADPRKAMDSMLSFLTAAGEAHHYATQWHPGSEPENLDLFSLDVVSWAGENLQELELAQLELTSPKPGLFDGGLV